MRTSFAVLVFFTLLSGSYETPTQKVEQKFLIIPGDINRPYEVMDNVIYVKTVESVTIGNAFVKATNDALKEVEEGVKKEGVDAVINTSIQLVIYSVKSGDELGQLVIFGKAIKFK